MTQLATARMDGSDGLVPDGIGPLLRTARRERNLTGRELARRIGVSPSLISHVESGRQRPSPRTLAAMLEVLGVELADLVARQPAAPGPAAVRQPLDILNTLARFSGRPQDGPVAVQRAQERAVLHFPAGMRYALLLDRRDPEVDFFEVYLEPGGTSDAKGELHVHPGREFGLVLSGSLRFQVGDQDVLLAAGDSIAYDSMTPHRSENASDQEGARSIWVCINKPIGSSSERGGVPGRGAGGADQA